MKRILTITMSVFLIAACSSYSNSDGLCYLYRIHVGDKYGFINDKGEIVIEPQYTYADMYFTEGVCYAELGEKKGIINSVGAFTVALPDSVYRVSTFVNGLASFYSYSGRSGIINSKGEVVIPAIHSDAYVDRDDKDIYLFYYDYDGTKYHHYLTDINGNPVSVFISDRECYFLNGLCTIWEGNKGRYIDRTGTIIIDDSFDEAWSFTEEGIAEVKKGDDSYYIDRGGNRLPIKGKPITDFHCNRAAVELNGNICLIDKTGKVISVLNVDDIDDFSRKDNLATIYRDDKASKIDTTGAVVLETNYRTLGPFINGIADVGENGKCGFINKKGEIVIPIAYDSIWGGSHFFSKESRIRAFRDYRSGESVTYFDLTGNLLWKDIPSTKKRLSYPARREDFVEYYDSNLADLDPIEGIYYVTNTDYYQRRDNPSIIGTNGTESTFYAVAYSNWANGYVAYTFDGSEKVWLNQFNKIGETNNYAIIETNPAFVERKNGKYSSEGRVTIDNPEQFSFRLETGHNDLFNFFVTYEFIKDYPPISDYERVLQAEWTGSGFAIADGYVVTNYHVTSGAKSIRIRGVNGDLKKAYKGTVLVSDKDHDLSIIRIVDKDYEHLGTIPYGVGKVSVDVGDDVFVLGYPMTSTMGEDIKLTNGIISSSSGYKGDESMYQISAAVQPGNSGGPLFNSNGVVIGVICGKHSDAENANYAIKISYLYGLIASSDSGIDIPDNIRMKNKSLSKKVKKIKDYVYLIECSSK